MIYTSLGRTVEIISRKYRDTNLEDEKVNVKYHDGKTGEVKAQDLRADGGEEELQRALQGVPVVGAPNEHVIPAVPFSSGVIFRFNPQP